MSEMAVLFCDLCNVTRNFQKDPPEEELVVDQDDENVILCNGNGYVFTTAEDAVQNRGWRETDYGHQCPVCAAEEDEQNGLDEATGAESGPTYEPAPVVAVALEGEAGGTRKPQKPFSGKKARRARA